MFLRSALLFAAFAICLTASLLGEEAAALRLFPSPASQDSKTENLWKTEELFTAPRTYEIEPGGFLARDGITPLLYEGAPFKGKPTRVFAWVGIPPGDGKVPGVVLVHGGGGTAYRDWVKIWMDRGYAAIAMDTNGAIPLTEDGMRVKSKPHEFAGPSPKGNGFETSDDPVSDQWMYHAVAAVIRAHSLLRSFPRVDPERTGITGISWGGVMTEIAASVDFRFKCAAPVYGCGFLGEDSFWLEKHFQDIAPAEVERWLRLWDPSQYVARIHMPVLFCNGTNDKFFRLDSWQKTYRLVPGPVTLSLRVRMTHGNPPHGDPPEITVFADSILKGGKPLPVMRDQGKEGNLAWTRYSSAEPIQSAQVIYTIDSGPWLTRNWQQAPARIEAGRVSAPLPHGVTAYYFTLKDGRGAMTSSAHIVLQPN